MISKRVQELQRSMMTMAIMMRMMRATMTTKMARTMMMMMMMKKKGHMIMIWVRLWRVGVSEAVLEQDGQ